MIKKKSSHSRFSRGTDLAAAAKEYSDFLVAWKDADPDLAQVLHARTFVAQHPVSNHSQASGS